MSLMSRVAAVALHVLDGVGGIIRVEVLSRRCIMLIQMMIFALLGEAASVAVRLIQSKISFEEYEETSRLKEDDWQRQTRDYVYHL